MTLAENIAALESAASELSAARNEGPLQNDVYEAIDDLCHFGHHALDCDTRVNYPVRAQRELELIQKLRETVSTGTDEECERYLPLLKPAEETLGEIARIPVPTEGHLGVLRIIKRRFAFLFDRYGFATEDEQPTGVRLVSGALVVELGWATQSSLSFCISRRGRGDFWVDDLLYLHGDSRYRSVPQTIHLKSESDVDQWFQFISGVLLQYGDELFRDSAGAFDRLAKAQSQRDTEYVAMMNAKSGLE